MGPRDKFVSCQLLLYALNNWQHSWWGCVWSIIKRIIEIGYICFISNNFRFTKKKSLFAVTKIGDDVFVDKVANPHKCKENEECPEGSAYPKVNNPCIDGEYCPPTKCSTNISFDSYDKGTDYCRCETVSTIFNATHVCQCPTIKCKCLR